VVGALYAAGIEPDELARRAIALRWRSFAQPAFSAQGLVSSRPIADTLRRWIGPVAFKDLRLPFAAVASDMMTGERVVLADGDLAAAVQASCSLAVVFTPTPINGRLLIDGGYSSQIPVQAARAPLGAEYVIAVDVNLNAIADLGPPRHMIGIAVHMAALWCRKNAAEELKLADGVISVDARGIGLTDLRRARDLLERGRQAARAFLDSHGAQLPV
jgi:NTE family protein